MEKYRIIENNNLKNINGGKTIWNYNTGLYLGKWISKHF